MAVGISNYTKRPWVSATTQSDPRDQQPTKWLWVLTTKESGYGYRQLNSPWGTGIRFNNTIHTTGQFHSFMCPSHKGAIPFHSCALFTKGQFHSCALLTKGHNVDGKTAKPGAYTAWGHPLLPTSDQLHQIKVLIIIFVFVCRGRGGHFNLLLASCNSCDVMDMKKSFGLCIQRYTTCCFHSTFSQIIECNLYCNKVLKSKCFWSASLFIFKRLFLDGNCTQTAQQLAVKDKTMYFGMFTP